MDGTCETRTDTVAVCAVLEALVERKLDAYLAAGRVEDYRLLRATRNLLLRGTSDDGYDVSSDDDSDSDE